MTRPLAGARHEETPQLLRPQRSIPMKTIFVQFKCRAGKAYAVADALVQDVEEISEVYSTSGQFDLIAKFYLGDTSDLGRFVTEQLQVIDGVTDTFTTVAFKAFGTA
jgi:DNA-binding Lrp family transcriptional regulator